MKNLILTTGLILMSITTVFAQEQKEKKKQDLREKIKKERIEYVKKKLVLTADEEKKFTPLYTKLVDELEVVHKDQETIEAMDLTFMTDEQCEKALNDLQALKEKEATLLKTYTAEFKKVLPVKKVLMIFKAQEEFKKQMVKRMRQQIKQKKEEKKTGN